MANLFPRNRCSRALLSSTLSIYEIRRKSVKKLRVKLRSYEIDRNSSGWLRSKVRDNFSRSEDRSFSNFVVENLFIPRSIGRFPFIASFRITRSCKIFSRTKKGEGVCSAFFLFLFFTMVGAFIKHSPFIFLLKSLVGGGVSIHWGACVRATSRPRTRGSNSRSKGSKP